MPLPRIIEAEGSVQGFSAPKGVERACPMTHGITAPRFHCFSAPKGVERACPAAAWKDVVVLPTRFSAPKGVERACPQVPTHAHQPRVGFQCPEGR